MLRAIALAAALAGGIGASPAQAGTNIIRDTEIENDIRALAGPIWQVGGLEPADVAVYLVQDNQINSFVSGGQVIFFNTGLLLRAENANELLGVIAHETGHITGGHLVRAREAVRNAMIESMIAMAAGLAASVAGKSGAPMLGAAGVGQRSLMQFSVAQESTADHAALNMLDRACRSARGLLRFFEIMQSNEMLSGDRGGDTWERTHPLTAERIQYVRDHVQRARCSTAPEPAEAEGRLRRIQVKLRAFLDPPATTLAAFPESDRSALARYARAIAYYRVPDLARALPAIDGLIRDFPDNPYYRELKGQMLFENGRGREAVRPYEDAVRLAPSAPLFRIALSQVYIESGDPALNKRAIAYLKDASREEGRDGQVWRLLATAYGRDNQIGMAALSLAEEGLATHNKKTAIQQAMRARQLLPRNTPAYLRADDIHREADRLDE
ncbi:MAG: M48 family metalloprotease [Alphaproteobacteria bacterium]